MCGRATLSASEDDLRRIFGLSGLLPLAPRFNIAPSQVIAVIREPGKLELLKWGLDLARGRGVNVRAETVARAPQYRDSFRTRRCLVVVDGFYEWKRLPGSKKQPFLVRREDGQPFALAGIWDRSTTPDGEVVDACAVITGKAQAVVAELHDRMPIVVAPEHFERWLEPRERPTDLLTPSAAALVAYPVSPLVNSPKNDDPRLIEPLDDPDRGKNLELF
jgi:putative SOS response-associated peptidase YedK